MSSEEENDDERSVFVGGCGYDAALGLQLVTDSGMVARVDKLLNGGTFGQVYIGTLNKRKVAIKLEQHDSQYRQLLHEGNVYRNLQGGPGIPVMYWFGIHASRYNALVLQLLGPTIYDLFVQCHHKLSLKTVLLLADQLFDIIEFVHEHKLVHRDLSPNNLMMGLGDESHKLFLADFGLAKQSRAGPCFVPSGRRHFRVTRPLVGTIRYASINAHIGHEDVGRKDDMEAIAYIFIYLLTGKLPWQGIASNNFKEKADKIAYIKRNISLEVLCEGLPDEFLLYLDYSRRLKLYELPDYTAVRTRFRELADARGFEYDYQYDWTIDNTQNNVPEKLRTESADSGISISSTD